MLVGATIILAPAPKKVPPHDPEYHCTVAPVPSEPPFSDKVVLSPKQIDVVPVMLTGATDMELTVTVTEAQLVVLQVPLYRTKYVVFVEGETVILLPVPAGVPPHESVNHCAVAPVPLVPPVTVKVVELPLHIVVVPEMLVGAVEGVFIVTTVLAQIVVLHVPLYLTK